MRESLVGEAQRQKIESLLPQPKRGWRGGNCAMRTLQFPAFGIYNQRKQALMACVRPANRQKRCEL